MGNFLGSFIGDLFVNGAISASEQTVFNWAYLGCLAFITAVHFFTRYKFYSGINKFFFYKHFSWTKLIIILIMTAISFVIYGVLLKSIYLHEVCDWFGSIMAKHIHLTGKGSWIDLDN